MQDPLTLSDIIISLKMLSVTLRRAHLTVMPHGLAACPCRGAGVGSVEQAHGPVGGGARGGGRLGDGRGGLTWIGRMACGEQRMGMDACGGSGLG